jgi:hypothetical protein
VAHLFTKRLHVSSRLPERNIRPNGYLTDMDSGYFRHDAVEHALFSR